MSAQVFISLLNPGIGLLLAAAFFLLWIYQRERPYILIAAISYGISAIGFFVQDVGPILPMHLERFISNACYLATGTLLCVAVIGRYRTPQPYILLSLCAGVGLLGTSWYLFVEPSLAGRIYFTSSAIGVMSLIIVARLLPVRDKQLVDMLLIGAAILTGITFLLRPITVASLNGGFGDDSSLVQSVYWTSVQFTQAMVSIVFALNLMVAVAMDRINALKLDAATDKLSGLLNRRGFEVEAAEALETCHKEGIPSCLLIADLDHFKRINDTYGHATGDEVIRLFSEHLQSLCHNGIIAGRIGGEEFAVLIPGTDLPAARLFAESLRAGLSHVCKDNMPDGLVPTTSIGLCRAEPGTTLYALLSDADEALYEAKRAGRNSIRTFGAGRPEELPMESRLTVNY